MLSIPYFLSEMLTIIPSIVIVQPIIYMSVHEIPFETFQGWEEIFPNNEERDRQFQDFLQEQRNYYAQNSIFAGEETREDPETGAPETIFSMKLGMGYRSVSLLPDGNIKMIFFRKKTEYMDEENKMYMITPDVGSKNHSWKYDEIKLLRERLMSHVSRTEDVGISSIDYKINMLVGSYLEGSSAYKSMQETMMKSGRTPLRIGFKLYPKEQLEEAQHLLATLEEQK